MKKLNNFIVTIIVLAILMTLLTACSNSTEPTTNNSETEEPAAKEPADEETKADVTLEGPYIITTCGQSPGAVMVNMVAMQAGLTSANDNTLTAESLKVDDYKTLIITTGTSMKGMGAAGTDVDAEIERCVDLASAAKEAGLTVVGAHIEGMARRTDSSDAASIEAIMGLADVILIIEESDSDGFFTNYAKDKNKQLIIVENTLAISSVLN